MRCTAKVAVSEKWQSHRQLLLCTGRDIMELDSGHTQIVSEPKSERVQQTYLFLRNEHTYINIKMYMCFKFAMLEISWWLRAKYIYIYTNISIYTFGNVA